MNDNEDCRKAFEEDHSEYIGTRNYAVDIHGFYLDGITQSAWNLYQAAWHRRPTGQVDFEKVVREWEANWGIHVADYNPQRDDLITRLKTSVPAEVRTATPITADMATPHGVLPSISASTSVPAESVEPWKEIDRLCSELKYIAGIVERGRGATLDPAESVSTAILGYVKELEAAKVPAESPRFVHVKAEFVPSERHDVDPAESVNAELVRALSDLIGWCSEFGNGEGFTVAVNKARQALAKLTAPTVNREVVDTGQSILKSWADDNDEFMHGTIWDDLAGRINKALKEANHG